MIKFAGHIIEVEKLFSKTENKSKFVKVSQAEQKVNTQAAQQFIEQRVGNPKFQTVQDFYFEAQKMGFSQADLNSIASQAKSLGYKDKTNENLKPNDPASQQQIQQTAQQFIQQFIQSRALKTVQDFYYEAQRMGLPQDVMNSIAELAKKQGFKDLTPKSN
jgi:hypothetical protein